MSSTQIIDDLSEYSVRELYNSMKDSVIDVSRMDLDGIVSLKQFVYENGSTGDILKLNVMLNDKTFLTNAIFVEDGYENSEITSNVLLPFEGKGEDQYVKIGSNSINYTHETKNVTVDGVSRGFGESFVLGGRNVTLARGSVVIILTDTLQKDFPQEGLQGEVIDNEGTVSLGDVTTTNTILIEGKELTGETSVSSYVFFRDATTDQRTCAIQYLKTVDLAQTACTATVNIGYVDGSDDRSLEQVIKYNSTSVDLRSVNSTGDSSISTLDVNGISFDSNSAGLILGDSTKFGIFYDESNDLLQIKYYDSIAGEYIVKREFSN